ncbi:MAG: tetratricopeptide repeat protein [Stygiobacter sp.]
MNYKFRYKNKFSANANLSRNNMFATLLGFLNVVLNFFNRRSILSNFQVMVRQSRQSRDHHDIWWIVILIQTLLGLSKDDDIVQTKFFNNHHKKNKSINFIALIKQLGLVIFFSNSLIFSQLQNLDNKFRLAQSYEFAGQFDKAENIYRELYQIQPFNNIYFEALNKSLISQKKYDEAISLIEEKIKTQPADVSNYGLLGTVYFMKDDIKKAYEVWENGIATNPKSYVVYRIIANYALENRAYEKAIEFLNQGKKIASDQYTFSLDLANIYALNMNFENAANEFCELLITNPEFIQMIKSRIATYISRPQAAEQTINAINKFLKSKSKIEILDLLASIYQQIGNYEKAFEVVDKMENDFNGNGSQYYFFALESFKSKNYNTALKSFEAILNKYPNSNYEASARIGFSKTKEEILNEKSFSKDELWKPITSQQIKFEQEYKQLITSYQKFIDEFKNNSNSAEAYFRIAEIYKNRLLDFEKADSIYHLIELQFPYTNYSVLSLINRAKIYIQQNKLDTAETLLFKVFQNSKSEPQNISEANFLLGKINFWLGKFSEAVSYFQRTSKNLEDDFANDALENLFIINSTKKDSVNFAKYAFAELLLQQRKEEKAIIEFKTLSENDNLFLINQFAKYKLAEILVFFNKFFEAEELLENLSKNQENPLFSEKSMFLLAQTQKYGEKNFVKAKKTYAQLLEFYPNSLYFDRVREELNAISN